MPSPFTPKTLSFLRALKRNNDREWFRARKPEYERHVRGPMIELIARLAVDLRPFAPDLVADPKTSLYRIYRDTRFSDDKTPLKTNAAAVFPPRGFPRHEGAGLLRRDCARLGVDGRRALHAAAALAARDPPAHRVDAPAVAPDRDGQGVYQRPRRAAGRPAHPRPARLPAGPSRRAATCGSSSSSASASSRPAFATSDDFYPELLRTFKALTPLLRFLNSSIRDAAAPPAVLLDGHGGRGRRTGRASHGA